MLLNNSPKSENMKYLRLYNVLSIIGCVHNDLNFDLVNVLVESMGPMESHMYNYVEVTRSQ